MLTNCDTRSHRRAGRKKGRPQASVQEPVPTPTANLVTGRYAAAGKAQGRLTIGPSTGKGKTGRANTSESLMRLRHIRTPERWLTKTVYRAKDVSFFFGSRVVSELHGPIQGHHGPGVQRTPSPAVSQE